MKPGTQWTALWYLGDELVHYETLPWDGAIGGLGFSDWAPPPELWQPGIYEVQIFVGHDWKVIGKFQVSGDPLTATPSPTSTPSITLTPLETESPLTTISP